MGCRSIPKLYFIFFKYLFLVDEPSPKSKGVLRKPNKEDITITNRMQKACELIGIPLIDHIIIGNGCYYSFQREQDKVS